jgi:hypothetical protein
MTTSSWSWMRPVLLGCKGSLVSNCRTARWYFYSRTNASGANKTAGKRVRTIRHHPELGYQVAESFEYNGVPSDLSAGSLVAAMSRRALKVGGAG